MFDISGLPEITKLYYIKFDDGTFLYGDHGHPYHAYYFFDKVTARMAAEGCLKQVEEIYGITGMTYTVETRDCEDENEWSLVVKELGKRVG